MLRQFYMNGDLWKVHFVSPHDDVLIDRTGQRTLAVSDYSTMTISIANNLYGELLNRVFIHELGHCVMFSYGLLPELHRMVRKPSRIISMRKKLLKRQIQHIIKQIINQI